MRDQAKISRSFDVMDAFLSARNGMIAARAALQIHVLRLELQPNKACARIGYHSKCEPKHLSTNRPEESLSHIPMDPLINVHFPQ